MPVSVHVQAVLQAGLAQMGHLRAGAVPGGQRLFRLSVPDQLNDPKQPIERTSPTEGCARPGPLIIGSAPAPFQRRV